MGSEARTVTVENAAELVAWCGGRGVVERDALDETKTFPGINVPTKNGVERASLGHMIIKQNDGTFEVFKGE